MLTNEQPTIYVDYDGEIVRRIVGADIMASRTRKTAALPAFQIKVASLPGSIFFSYEALLENASRALIEYNAVADFRIDGDVLSLQAALGDLDWDYRSIMAIVADPHADHVSCYYDLPLDYALAA